MIAKPIYESIPYLNFFFGAGCLLIGNSFITTLLGIMMFFYGANIWRLRSNARRVDHKVNRIRVKKHYYYYEFKPFILLTFGLLIIRWVPHQLVTITGVIICLIALLILALRVLNRRSRSMV
ncbi:hypothetical protein [Pseudoalteromonas sp. SaAl2]